MIGPLARKEGLYIERLQEDAVLYDKTTHEAFRLNPAMFTVWAHADGTRTVDDLVHFLGTTSTRALDRDMVLLAIKELVEAKLMSCPLEAAPALLPSRRNVANKLAMAGFSASLLPFVSSIVAPLPAMARSYSPQTYTQELKLATAGYVDADGLQNRTATRDFGAGVGQGTAGLAASAEGQTAKAQQDFQTAEADFNGMLRALGLPPL